MMSPSSKRSFSVPNHGAKASDESDGAQSARGDASSGPGDTTITVGNDERRGSWTEIRIQGSVGSSTIGQKPSSAFDGDGAYSDDENDYYVGEDSGGYMRSGGTYGQRRTQGPQNRRSQSNQPPQSGMNRSGYGYESSSRAAANTGPLDFPTANPYARLPDPGVPIPSIEHHSYQRTKANKTLTDERARMLAADALLADELKRKQTGYRTGFKWVGSRPKVQDDSAKYQPVNPYDESQTITGEPLQGRHRYLPPAQQAPKRPASSPQQMVGDGQPMNTAPQTQRSQKPFNNVEKKHGAQQPAEPSRQAARTQKRFIWDSDDDEPLRIRMRKN
ncbi:hypothetical protein B0J14DRAFT_308183 [Halenospora varia]|nr:hypothetical protein B0J14DRAFT_308183 [Halenospora varia]